MTTKVIHSILIANRGEIARRIIRTCHKMGILAVSIYASDESDAAWIREANQSVNLGDGNLADTYLNIDKIIGIAKVNNCDAIHPGYGFLSENASFAKACKDNNIQFIGPSADVIELMGNKLKARAFVSNIGIPLPIGLSGTAQEIIKQQDQLHFPAIIKAAAGGGGKGMQIVRSTNELASKLEQASKEAELWFGSGEVFVEQYFENARHIEVQVLSDQHDNHLHLFERECTLQRNYQKVIEEAPSPTLNEEQRAAICDAALKISQASNYTNAGTIEFLWENGAFYFLEMNTRIQVEHPVTEAITGIDLIEQQINIAANKVLSFKQDDINITGHAIEVRIYAEQPHSNFKPSGGYMHLYQETKDLGVRYDSSYAKACELSTAYDGLISKIISHKNTRKESILLLEQAIQSTLIHGVHHNGNFIQRLLSHPLYIKNKVHTKFIEQHYDELIQKDELDLLHPLLFASAISMEQTNNSNAKTIWNSTNSIENIKQYRFLLEQKEYTTQSHMTDNQIEITIHDKLFLFIIKRLNQNHIQLVLNKTSFDVFISKGEEAYWIQIGKELYLLKSQSDLAYVSIKKKENEEVKKDYFEITSPLHGKVSNIFIELNQMVKQGEPLLTIESMKTDNQIICPANGIVEKILIENNKAVKENQLLVTFKN